MEVIEIKDNDDKTCTITVNITEEENQILINYAINDILKKQIEEYNTTEEKKNDIKMDK